jgi:hypothetical protein
MFNSAKLKIKWADEHVANVVTELRAFVQANPQTADLAENTEDGKVSFNLSFSKQPPVRFSLLIADIIHNLRVALDHANWELRGLDGGAQDRWTKLPIADNRKDYEALCGGIKTPRGDLPDFFRHLEFYKGGRGELIYFLHELDVIDKHIILPIKVQRARVFKIVGGDGMLTINLPDSPRSERDKNTDPALDIFFGKIEGFEFKPVIPTLVHLSNAVKQTVGQLGHV